ncbi:hypothetical protein [Pseudactinotalea sp. Z1748]|uniref:hypothetical protein n=1 Tax=Pseudactinotalea sp. Z1748 TaxID=3413027 RepID=UPI003C7B88C5
MSEHNIPGVDRPSLDVLADIAQMPTGPQREVAVEQFIAARLPLFNRYARSLCRTNSVPANDYLEDITAIVAEVAWEMIREALQDPGHLSKYMTWEAIHFRRARSKVRSYVDRTKTPASGMTTVMRRYREVQRTRSLLRGELDREPSDPEVVAETNKRLSHLKDAAYQGMHITSADLQMPGQVGDPDIALESHKVVDYAEDYILHPTEGATVVRQTITAAREHHPTTGRVAELWMGDVYAEGGPGEGTDTVTHICHVLALSRPAVQGHISQVRQLAVGVLAGMGVDLEGVSA